MADGDVAPPDDSYDDTGSSGGGVGTWLSTHKGAAAGGGLVLLIAVYVYIKRKSSASSSSSSGSTGTSTGPAVYEVAPGSLTSGGAYGSSIGYDQGIAGGAVGGSTGGGVSGTGASSSGSSSSGSVNGNALAGFQAIGGPSQGSFLTNAGYDTFAVVGGQPVQVTKGATRLPAFGSIPQGSTLYWNPSYKG